MALGTRVEGGTDAGRKRPLKPASTWLCGCPSDSDERLVGIEQPSWRTRCEDCGTSKP